MKRLIKRLAIGLTLVLVLGTATLAVAVAVRQNRTFDAPYPDLHASTDRAVIARGRYLVTGPAHCADCHAADGDHSDEPPLVGGHAFDLPIGTVYAPNITPDDSTGIGRYTDPEIARALRYGVHASGRAVLPFMPFQDLADDDLVAVLSYLRSRPAIDHAVADSHYNVLGRAAKAFLLEPRGPSRPIRAHVEPGETIAYGDYLANSVGNCVGCHTRHSLRTGEQLGVPFSGGMPIDSDADGTSYVSVNLTPDPGTGRITSWTEDAFVARFRNATRTASPMPWQRFRHLSEPDLRAIYRYLRSLPPTPIGQDR